MDFIKDFCLILLFFLFAFFIIRYNFLKNEIIKQRECFIKILSHDFRVSVIAQIRGLELVQKLLNLPPDENYLISEVNNSCKYTMDMLTTLINIYKIENGELTLNYETVNLCNIISKIFKEYEQIVAEKSIDLCCDIKNCCINVDRESISCVLRNLIYTVLQYSEKNSTVTISSVNLSDKLYLSVNYTGSSMSYEECRRMYSVSPAYSTVGHGIQMYLCKKIIDLNKGHIRFKSLRNRKNVFEIFVPQALYSKCAASCV